MMEGVFLKLLNMSVTAGWIILAVTILRAVLKKAPRWIRCALWGIAGLRLVIPVFFESRASLIPSPETVSPSIVYSELPGITSGIPAINHAVNPVISRTFTPVPPGAGANTLQIVIRAAAIVWLAGMAAMLLCALVSYIRLRRRVETAIRLRDNIWQCEQVQSPFILGLFRPRIYLPFDVSEEEMTLVLAHEHAHLKRRDHLIKPLAFLLLAVYWFNPLVWLAYVLFCRDIELACDERVIKKIGEQERRAYSSTLLSRSISRRSIAACPVAFGEVHVKERIKMALNYKKPAFWIIIAAVVVTAAAAVCLLTNPKRKPSSSALEKAASQARNIEAVSAWLRPGIETDTILARSGYAKGSRLADYLMSAGWTEAAAPDASLSRKESAEFTVGDYRITVYREAPYACVATEEKEDWFKTGEDDFDKAAELFVSGKSFAVSGTNVIPLAPFADNLSLQEIKERVFWLEPRQKWMPFEVFINGQKSGGWYHVYDAETYRPRFVFHPSGLPSEAFLLLDTVNGRSYIVTFYAGNDMYCLGVRVPEDVLPFPGGEDEAKKGRKMELVSYACLYPVSSGSEQLCDTGFIYQIGEDQFTILNKNSGEVVETVSIPPVFRQWKELSQSDWESMFPPGKAPDISKYKRPMMQILPEKYVLFNMDSATWLGETRDGGKTLEKLYELIYDLKKR